MTLTDQRTTGTSLIAPELFNRLTARIAAEHPELSADMPARIMDQALAFLAACVVTTEPIGPSDLVDIGWHTFIFHTIDYAAFCERVAGRFVHHVPDPTDEQTGTEWPTMPVSRAVEAIRAAGYGIDPQLWGMSGGKCTQCHAGCTDSPVGK